MGSHSGRGKHINYIKEKSNLGVLKALGKSMFTYVEKNSAGEMRTTWEKIVQNIGITLGQDISTELGMRTLMVIPYPTHSKEILGRHMSRVELHNRTHSRLREARNKVLESLAADVEIDTLDVVLKTAETQNQIEEADLEIH